MQAETVILVTSIGSMSARCVIRQLRKLSPTRLVGCDLHPASWLASSVEVDAFHQIRPSSDVPAYLQDIQRICAQERISHLIALTDPEVDILSACRNDWAAHQGLVICTPDAATVETVRDKLALAQMLNQTAVETIPTMAPDSLVSATPALPLLFKPRRGRSSQGQFIARTGTDLAYALKAIDSSNYVVQPLLEGKIIVADVVRHADTGATAVACREELIRTSTGAGMTVRTVENASLTALATEVAQRTGVNGCVNVEFLQIEGRYLLMDVNPRFSAGVAFSVLAGYDMVQAHWGCFQGVPPKPCAINLGQIFTRALQECVAPPIV